MSRMTYFAILFISFALYSGPLCIHPYLCNAIFLLDESLYSFIYNAMKKNRHRKRNSENTPCQWRGHLWLEGRSGTFLGYGRIVLLERIRDYGSISQAAKSMEMSYKHSWDLLDSMNRQAGRKMVETTRGGTQGGGATLTPAGEQAIETFWRVHRQFQSFLDRMTEELDGDVCG